MTQDHHRSESFDSQYRRHLPHIQYEGEIFFVTFCTKERWQLPECVRSQVLKHCLHDHGRRVYVYGAVVMPDHVHMVLAPLADPNGAPNRVKDILRPLKGASSHSVNRALNRQGSVWQDESFDHALRTEESAVKKVEYICENPVRKGLVARAEDYRWLWRDWVEGAALMGGRPH